MNIHYDLMTALKYLSDNNQNIMDGYKEDIKSHA